MPEFPNFEEILKEEDFLTENLEARTPGEDLLPKDLLTLPCYEEPHLTQDIPTDLDSFLDHCFSETYISDRPLPPVNLEQDPPSGIDYGLYPTLEQRMHLDPDTYTDAELQQEIDALKESLTALNQVNTPVSRKPAPLVPLPVPVKQEALTGDSGEQPGHPFRDSKTLKACIHEKIAKENLEETPVAVLRDLKRTFLKDHGSMTEKEHKVYSLTLYKLKKEYGCIDISHAIAPRYNCRYFHACSRDRDDGGKFKKTKLSPVKEEVDCPPPLEPDPSVSDYHGFYTWVIQTNQPLLYFYPALTAPEPQAIWPYPCSPY